jgi:hypothetical protein
MTVAALRTKMVAQFACAAVLTAFVLFSIAQAVLSASGELPTPLEDLFLFVVLLVPVVVGIVAWRAGRASLLGLRDPAAGFAESNMVRESSGSLATLLFRVGLGLATVSFVAGLGALIGGISAVGVAMAYCVLLGLWISGAAAAVKLVGR